MEAVKVVETLQVQVRDLMGHGRPGGPRDGGSRGSGHGSGQKSGHGAGHGGGGHKKG